MKPYDTIDYAEFVDQAMRGVVRQVMRSVEKNGLSGEHYFYLTFRTDHPEARVSPALKSRYPQEMTIVLQHQFWDFRVEEHLLHVTLSFGGVPERLEIPFSALTAFADPSVKFGLQFQHANTLQGAGSAASVQSAERAPVEEEATDSLQAEIISLDAFRKK